MYHKVTCTLALCVLLTSVAWDSLSNIHDWNARTLHPTPSYIHH